MSKKILAVIGSYRKGGITDQATDVILGTVQRKGWQTQKIYLTDKRIKFCNNCRTCAQEKSEERHGKCVLNDDMNDLLPEIDRVDGIILASPINIGTVTAIMKRFLERLVVYTYWPWGTKFPKMRIEERKKKAITVTSSTCPALIGRILMPSAANVMKEAAGFVGAKVVKSLHFGQVCIEKHQGLNKKQIALAEVAGSLLA